MVSKSDNNACDILIHQLGGTHVVNDYIHEIGIRELSIQATEKEMAEAWEIQFNNWTTPIAITELLKKVYEGTILKSQSLDFLNRILTETTTGPNRIKGQLPPGTLVAHKTGTSGTNKAGITAAINDIGIIQLPDKTKVALSVFICNSSETLETNEKIIADIAKLVWNYFVKGKE
jgi:beta-lactamase class A